MLVMCVCVACTEHSTSCVERFSSRATFALCIQHVSKYISMIEEFNRPELVKQGYNRLHYENAISSASLAGSISNSPDP